MIASGGLGGREMQPVKLAIEMKKKAHNLFLLVKNNSQSIPLIKKAKLPYFELKMNGYLNLFSLIPLKKILIKNKIDVIHTHYSKSLFFLQIARILSRQKIKLILTQRMGCNVKKNDPFHKYVFLNTDQIITVSKYVRSRLLWAAPFLKNRIKVVYNGYPFMQQKKKDYNKKEFKKKYKIMNKDVSFCLVAQLNEGKGHLWVLKALEMLINKYMRDHVKIFFIGKGHLDSSFKEYVRKNRIQNYVEFTGFTWDVNYYYQNIDVVLVPSKSEAGGNVIIEGMATGKPVICSDTGYFPEVINNKKNGLIVKYNNVKELAEAMKFLMDKPGLRKEYGKKGKQRVLKNFHYQDTIEQYLSIYKKS